MSADTFDPTHINPWFAVAAILALLIWFAALEVRAAIDNKRANQARAHLEARKHVDPNTLCSVLACRQPWTVVVHGRGLCNDDAQRITGRAS